ncbi:GFA family protein [uncultured Jannaschia sp.]|uniref:GFA family protein n=1 Tax=uncultured Jannaschia sp. TaxID=293347 RepID=UPI0026063980|nr:GFA family protein [uncultured Jannaschia sp.]
MARTGGCLCGQVRFTVTGRMRPVVACHCEQCQRHSGNYVAATSAPRHAIAITGEVRWFQSSDVARRGFCPTCGANLFWDGPGTNLSIMAGAIDKPTGLALVGHIFCRQKGDWYTIPEEERQVPEGDPTLTTKVDT